MHRPAAVVLDVNETLSDLSPMAQAFEKVGAPAHLAALWFASVLRDGFALTAAGESRPFAEVAAGALAPLLSQAGVDDPDGATQDVMSTFGALELHPDVEPGLRALAEADLQVVTLTNGSTSVSERLLSRAGVRDLLDRLLSVEDAGAWKPAAAAYEHAQRVLDLPAADLLMVAVHPWDLDGAARAGLRTAWLNRDGGRYPAHMGAPDLTATGLDDLAAQLVVLAGA